MQQHFKSLINFELILINVPHNLNSKYVFHDYERNKI